MHSHPVILLVFFPTGVLLFVPFPTTGRNCIVSSTFSVPFISCTSRQGSSLGKVHIVLCQWQIAVSSCGITWLFYYRFIIGSLSPVWLPPTFLQGWGQSPLPILFPHPLPLNPTPFPTPIARLSVVTQCTPVWTTPPSRPRPYSHS